MYTHTIRTPQSTATGQSGPPTSRATFSLFYVFYRLIMSFVFIFISMYVICVLTFVVSCFSFSDKQGDLPQRVALGHQDALVADRWGRH